ncbi:MAG: uroporphyrinogen-III synthase, partial [Bacillota bacterium]
LYYPTIEIKGPIYTEKLKKTTNNIEKYNWILFTSKNGIKYWFQFLKKEDIDIRRLFPVKFGVIGPGTGQELKKYGIKADFMPSQYTTSVMVEEFISQMEEKGTDILLPRADIASKGIINRLKETQNTVTDISIYKTVIPDVSGERLISHLEERDLNLITFTSSSTVNYLMKIFKTDKDKILKIPAACIGPVTAETAREQGFRVVAEAGEHTIKGLVNKIKEYYLI